MADDRGKNDPSEWEKIFLTLGIAISETSRTCTSWTADFANHGPSIRAHSKDRTETWRAEISRERIKTNRKENHYPSFV